MIDARTPDPVEFFLSTMLTPVDSFFIEDQEETAACRRMAAEAAAYLKQFPWCEKLMDAYVGFCYPGVVGAFAFRVGASNPTVPKWVWVVNRDLPLA